ncbi:MAG: zf-HC2 domain-containing protein [Vicinamibacterales bacterium]|nr:zf-HC2 domain-containing protein [Vicinamibacterales bacterium]
MLNMTCEYVRSELSAYHDEELPVTVRIGIADHLENCAGCAVEADDLVAISSELRSSGRLEDAAWMPGLSRLESDILQRFDAEDNASVASRFRRLFDDPQRASASFGVSVVASVCMAIWALVMAQGPQGHPGSLKAVMNQSVRSYDIYLPEDSVELPRADAEAVMPAAVMNQDSGDGVSAFSALVTQDGHLADLELLSGQTYGRRLAPATHDQLSALLNAAATARFEPARVAGSPVPLNVVWLVTHRTVRPPVVATVRVHIDGFRL